MNEEMTFLDDLEDTAEESAEPQPVLLGPYGDNRVPLAIEFVFTLMKIITVVSALVVLIFSILAGVGWFTLAVRLLVTIGIVGLFGYLISWVVEKYYIQASVTELKELEEIKKRSDEDNDLSEEQTA